MLLGDLHDALLLPANGCHAHGNACTPELSTRCDRATSAHLTSTCDRAPRGERSVTLTGEARCSPATCSGSRGQSGTGRAGRPGNVRGRPRTGPRPLEHAAAHSHRATSHAMWRTWLKSAWKAPCSRGRLVEECRWDVERRIRGVENRDRRPGQPSSPAHSPSRAWQRSREAPSGLYQNRTRETCLLDASPLGERSA